MEHRHRDSSKVVVFPSREDAIENDRSKPASGNSSELSGAGFSFWGNDPEIDRLLKRGTYPCACGKEHAILSACDNVVAHEEIREKIRGMFQRGDRVYYNRWAYPMNCPAIFLGMVRPTPKNWAWVRVKFDHLTNPRPIPAISERGFHLSKEPLSDEAASYLIRP